MTAVKKGVILILTVSIFMFLLEGCGGGVDYKSPEAIVKSLVRSYQDQNEQAVKECYGLSEDEEVQEDIQKEINYNMRLFKAYQAVSIDFEKSDSLGKSGDSQLIYVWFNYKSEDAEQKCPVMSFYFVKEKDKRYFVIPAKDVTEEMSEYSRGAYERFMDTRTYKNYQKNFEEFQEKNPSYKESLNKRFSQSANEI